MKKIILATGNEGKVRELNTMLRGHYNVISQSDNPSTPPLLQMPRLLHAPGLVQDVLALALFHLLLVRRSALGGQRVRIVVSVGHRTGQAARLHGRRGYGR